MWKFVKAMFSGKYAPGFSGPAAVAIAFGLPFFWPTIQDYPYYRAGTFATAIAWLFIAMVLFAYDFVNDELNKRDDENQLHNPTARYERTYVGICRFIKEGEDYLSASAPTEKWEAWDSKVKIWLTTRIDDDGMLASIYVLNSRPHGTEVLLEPPKAVEELRQTLERFHIS